MGFITSDAAFYLFFDLGHPPKHVLEHLLTSGYIVCCQAYIFANFGSGGQSQERAGCSRGEALCKYFHPPEVFKCYEDSSISDIRCFSDSWGVDDLSQ